MTLAGMQLQQPAYVPITSLYRVYFFSCIYFIFTRKPCCRRRTARCRRCKLRFVSKFTTASYGFSATARLSGRHQRSFKCWNYTQYADFHGRDVRHGDSRKSRHTTKITVIINIILQVSIAVFFGRCRKIFRAKMAQPPPLEKNRPDAYGLNYYCACVKIHLAPGDMHCHERPPSK